MSFSFWQLWALCESVWLCLLRSSAWLDCNKLCTAENPAAVPSDLTDKRLVVVTVKIGSERDRQAELGHQRQLPHFISNNIPLPWAQVCRGCLRDGLACLMNEYARQFFPDCAASLRDCDRVQPPSANQFSALWRSSQHLRTHLPEARTTLLSLRFLPAPCRMFLYFSFEPKWWDGNYFTSSVPGLLL